MGKVQTKAAETNPAVDNVKDPNITGNDAAETKETKTVKAEKTKTVVIPTSEKDPDNYVPVVINGTIYQVKKGEEVEVPLEVYELLKRAGYLGIKA